MVLRASLSTCLVLGLLSATNVAQSFDNGQIAHVKLLLDSPSSAMKMSLVFSDIGVDGVKGGRKAKGHVLLNVNGRVISTPDKLREVMRRSVTSSPRSRTCTSPTGPSAGREP